MQARPLPARPTAGLQLDFSSKGSRNDGIKEWERGTTVPECHLKKIMVQKSVYLFILFVRDIKYVPSIAATMLL
jgi:hypothetical protein